MNSDGFPRPPIDREEIARVRARLRQLIRDALPAADPLLREMQENIINGVRGRDLLSIEAYREQFTARADEISHRLRRLREEIDEQARRRPDEK
ncbi:hypothetical protein Aca07nite_69460 [Actinoplanes capillaceus]|uniref:Uncharacterized protein n=1 Tax=Actinoplanes campanulatus TaxID=113559 RepID=A0ABQ3WTQ0_9ACTN|nr:hypothetical protein [Actinoplanes capillaceus]GID49671.1 hypothetical protein Aca07nite_69460 [Actinoplanes capillaceus]